MEKMERNDLIKLAIAACKNPATTYAKGDPSEVIRNALIAENGGSDKIDIRSMRNNGNSGKIFQLVEDLIMAVVWEGLPKSSKIWDFVEYRNGAEGDKPDFRLHKDSILAVAEMANGSLAVRKQRIFGDKTETLVPTVHGVATYEELRRLLSGRITWTEYVDTVTRSLSYDTNKRITKAFADITGTTRGVISVSGSFAEDNMVGLISSVEKANNGETARIFGTKTALRKLNMNTHEGTLVDNDYYNMGYMGKFNGTDVFELKDAYEADGATSVLGDDKLYVIATDDKFIKYYTEGTAFIKESDGSADMTKNYTLLTEDAVAVLLSKKFGVYTITA